jgi:hypothetical protein
MTWNPRRARQVGLFLAFGCVGLLLAAWSFQERRDCYREGFLGVCVLTTLVGFPAALLLARRSFHRDRYGPAALYLWGLLTAGLLGGWVVGGFYRQHDQRLDREKADTVVTLLEAHRREHGEYPAALEELEGYSPVTICHQPLHYERRSPGEFELAYSHGWYAHVYESTRGAWHVVD